jgi:thiosulfate/3-mercaptopyruvate sulfurtransferase
MFKRLVRGGLAAVLMAMLAASGCGKVTGGKELDTEKIAVNFCQEVERGGYQIVTTLDLKAWIDAKKDLLIVDTMPFADSYKKNHIPGAVNFEFPIPEVTDMDDKKKGDFEKLLGPDKDKQLVFYCGFVKCTRSHNGAMWAKKLGYTNVYRHPGGIKAWLEAGYTVKQAK